MELRIRGFCILALFLMALNVASGNIEVVRPKWGDDWLTMILIFAGSVALACLCFFVAWFLLVAVRSGNWSWRRAAKAIVLSLSAALLVGIAVSVLLAWGEGAPRAVFDSEDLTFEILPGSEEYYMSGYYVVKNPTASHLRSEVRVPLPEEFWRDTTLEVNSPGSRVTRVTDGFEVWFRLEPSETLRIYVSGYRAIEIGEEGARSLVSAITTTRQWGQPLREATYTILLPGDCHILDTYPEEWESIPVSKPSRKGIRMRETDFMPERDLLVVFNQTSRPCTSM